jgi:hypothetical protein
MIKPTKYKSIATADLKNKAVLPLTEPQKVQANTILQKLVDLIKAKHA